VQEIDLESMSKVIGIVGGGVMGTGLARFFLACDFEVRVVEADDNLAERFRLRLIKAFAKDMELGRTVKAEAAARLERLQTGIDIPSLSGASLIIEAVPENLALKRQVLRQLEGVVGDNTILASNTSALPISALAAAMKRPDRFIGTHFFNPAQVMPLVEVVPGFDTAPAIVDQTMGFLRACGKKPVKVKDCPGFLVNRIMGAYMNEVMRLLEDGVGIKEVEETAQGLGFPMGPIALGEMAGWDVVCAANETLERYYGMRFAVPSLLKRLDVEGRHGVKAGKGLLDHSLQPPVAAGDLAVVSKPLSGIAEKAELEERLSEIVFAEAMRCLDEGVCQAVDIDQAMMLGAGLPKGPLTWADEIGLDNVLARLKSLFEKFGPRFWPPPILQISVIAGYTGKSAGRGLGGRY